MRRHRWRRPELRYRRWRPPQRLRLPRFRRLPWERGGELPSRRWRHGRCCRRRLRWRLWKRWELVLESSGSLLGVGGRRRVLIVVGGVGNHEPSVFTGKGVYSGRDDGVVDIGGFDRAPALDNVPVYEEARSDILGCTDGVGLKSWWRRHQLQRRRGRLPDRYY